MLFTKDECIHLIAALETYNDTPRGLLNPDVQNTVCSSALSKLKSFNLFTSFTKQEFTMMFASVLFSIELLDRKHIAVPDILWTLHDKVGSLSLPDESSL